MKYTESFRQAKYSELNKPNMLFCKGKTLQHFQSFLHDKDTSFCPESLCKQGRKAMINGPCSLPSRMSLTPLSL